MSHFLGQEDVVGRELPDAQIQILKLMKLELKIGLNYFGISKGFGYETMSKIN